MLFIKAVSGSGVTYVPPTALNPDDPALTFKSCHRSEPAGKLQNHRRRACFYSTISRWFDLAHEKETLADRQLTIHAGLRTPGRRQEAKQAGSMSGSRVLRVQDEFSFPLATYPDDRCCHLVLVTSAASSSCPHTCPTNQEQGLAVNHDAPAHFLSDSNQSDHKINKHQMITTMSYLPTWRGRMFWLHVGHLCFAVVETCLSDIWLPDKTINRLSE